MKQILAVGRVDIHTMCNALNGENNTYVLLEHRYCFVCQRLTKMLHVYIT